VVRETKQHSPAEFLLVMLARQVKLLIWAKVDAETLKLAPWQIGKLKKQASFFDKKNDPCYEYLSYLAQVS